MDPTIVVFFVILIAALTIGAFMILRRNPEGSEDATTLYAEGLNFLLAGEKEQALKKLRETVKKDSQNIDAYLKIGDILLDQGQPARAVNVHKYLTVRQGLSPKQRQAILKSLARDYLVAGEYSNALGVLEKALADDRNASWAREMKVEIFEMQHDWPKAFQAFKELQPKNGELRKRKLAYYKTQEGMQLLDEEHEKEAQARFKDAVKIDPQYPAAYLYLAESYRKSERWPDALKILKEFVVKVPTHAHLAFNRIEELMYEGGVYNEVEGLYLDLIDKQADNLTIRLALAENYERKGENKKATAICLEILDQDQDHARARKNLVRLYHKAGKDDEALTLALELIDESLRPEKSSNLDLSSLMQSEGQD